MRLAQKINKSRKLLGAAAGLLSAAAGFRYARRKRARIEEILAFKERRRQLRGAPAEKPQPGDILLFHHAHGQSLFITLFTHSPFYHAAIYAGDGHVVEARPQGVIHNSLEGRENDFIVVPGPCRNGKKALAWALTQLGSPYDRTDMLVIVLEHIFTHLRLNYTPRGKYTCAEFVATAYHRTGTPLFPERDLSDLVPADLARLLPSEARARLGLHDPQPTATTGAR